VTRLKWKLVLVRLEIVLILTQDRRCMFCAERTIGLEIIFDAPDETPRRRGSWEYHFSPFGDGVSVTAKIGARFAPNIP
jgi:hypothetical protein